MVEVAMATLLLLIGMSGLTSAFLSSLNFGRSNQETGVALNSARDVFERLESENFADLFRIYNTDPSDDPDGPGTAVGKDFAVPGLQARADDLDGAVGQILFPTTPVGASSVALRETVVDEALGLPRDLNGDGEIDALDHAEDYMVLPVTIRLDWRGPTGNRRLDFRALLMD